MKEGRQLHVAPGKQNREGSPSPTAICIVGALPYLGGEGLASSFLLRRLPAPDDHEGASKSAGAFGAAKDAAGAVCR